MLKAILQKLGLWQPAPAALALYGACVHEARREIYYDDLGVPDTVDGRFDLLALMVALVVLRLEQLFANGANGANGASGRALAQDVVEALFADLEQNLRAMGASDEGMRYRIRDMTQAFMGRMRAYGAAAAPSTAGNDAVLWVPALGRNIYRGAASDETVRRLSERVRQLRARLAATADHELATGNFGFAKADAGAKT